MTVRQRLVSLPRPVKILLWVLLALLAYAIPLLNPPILTTPGSDFASVMFTVTLYCLVALGLNVVVGYAGLLDLGYVGFYAIGAYTVAVLTSAHGNWPFLLALPAALVVSMIAGVVLGTPTLRVRGDYLAIVTLGFGEIIRLVGVNSEWLGGSKGITDVPRPPSLGGETGLLEIPPLVWIDGTPLLDTRNPVDFLVFGFSDAVPYYWLGLTAVIAVLIADVLIKDSRVGRAWEAIREDEDAAELMGVPTFRFKLLAFATGAVVGGLAGALFATRQSFINPQSFLLMFSILYLAAVVIGGQGNRWGVLLGAFLVAYLPERFRGLEDFRVLVFGMALVALATLRPQGILPPRRTARARRLRRKLSEIEEGEDPAHA